MKRNIKIISTGIYLPNNVVTSVDISEKVGVSSSWIEKKSGVISRRYVTNETSSYMGAMAIQDALQRANLTYEDLDCIVCTSGTAQQEIPCTAALIQEQLGKQMSGTPCFDINSTCLSFVTGLDMMSFVVHQEKYNRIVLVSSEIASVGLNWNQKESCVLFGDGACAVIIEKTPNSEKSVILASLMETYSKGAHMTEIKGGGSMLHPREHTEDNKEDFLFHMDGRGVFRLSSQVIDGVIERLFEQTSFSLQDIDFVVPHQASGMALEIMRKKLNIPKEKFVRIIENHGNTISSSIPMALHHIIKNGQLKRGDKVLLLGTSAGLSIGGVIFEY